MVYTEWNGTRKLSEHNSGYVKNVSKICITTNELKEATYKMMNRKIPGHNEITIVITNGEREKELLDSINQAKK